MASEYGLIGAMCVAAFVGIYFMSATVVTFMGSVAGELQKPSGFVCGQVVQHTPCGH